MDISVQKIDIFDLEPNTGQIEGLPANPRFIKDEKYKRLIDSLKEDPEMLLIRELIVIKAPKGNNKFIIIGGNMRFRAGCELGHESFLCKVLPIDFPVEKIRAISIKDNVGYGDWDWESLANDWDLNNLEHWGLDVPNMQMEVDDEEQDPIVDVVLKVKHDNKNQLKLLIAELSDRGFVCELKE